MAWEWWCSGGGGGGGGGRGAGGMVVEVGLRLSQHDPRQPPVVAAHLF